MNGTLPEIVDGWLTQARCCPSPNCNARPEGEDVSLLVIHNISLPPEQYGGLFVEQFFCNELDCDAHPYFDHLRELRVSAHLLIDRAGMITQFVPLHMRAWHAGESSFAGRDNCNDYSIGIELEGSDNDAYTSFQYSVLAELTRVIMNTFPAIELARIAGHSDIAPQRKTDPGPAFDWDLFRQLVLEGTPPP